jgi:hypothetical protein
VSGQGLRGMADNRLSGQQNELLRRFRVESVARTGGDKDGCDSHGATDAVARGAGQSCYFDIPTVVLAPGNSR